MDSVAELAQLASLAQGKLVIRVESLGSVWLIDEDRQQYMRMPKTEGPRPRETRAGLFADAAVLGETLTEVAPELVDLVWLPYIEWQLGKRDVWLRARRHWAAVDHVVAPSAVELDWLQINTPTGGWIYAPVSAHPIDDDHDNRKANA